VFDIASCGNHIKLVSVKNYHSCPMQAIAALKLAQSREIDLQNVFEG
jgi:hypothetical protein